MMFAFETDEAKVSLEIPGDMDPGDIQMLLAGFFEYAKLVADAAWMDPPQSAFESGKPD